MIQADLTEIRRTLSTLFRPGDVVELRALADDAPEWNKTKSGYFDNFDLMAKAAFELNENHNVYVTLNPVVPDLLARRANRVAAARKDGQTGDQHIACRRWLPVDCDPRRLSGICSTDVEHAAGLARARAIADTAKTRFGWPQPIIADSGNGGHLLFPLDLPNNDDATAAVQRALARLDREFGDGFVAIDQTVFNAARIWRLYGTVNRKGDNISARPYRVSRLIEVPNKG